ncbi:subtilisin-like serine protease [Rivularia sp. PCC 7116]|uniref:S8 family peptidase n=1 Tax=Rivularia sp. PCC 7116 TaxID=373994 RepID=UPI00029F2FC0|nr:S8 family peptidase [Rivularia sp. PCC 7116]AFY56355.1 subtilisin-like serine protease [Rivularia sp. PCC 7116]
MRFECTDIFADIDPRLQRLIQRRRRGLSTPPTASTEVGEVAVIAKVNDVRAWRSMTEVREGAEVGSTPNGDIIVTARVPVSRLQSVRTSPCVVSLEASQNLQLTTEDLTPQSPSLVGKGENWQSETTQQKGKNAVVGIIDVGCDFVHQNFRHPDGSTRILALWDQDGSSDPDSPFGYGKVYRSAEINQALKSENPYSALGYYPGKIAHGTHVMDIATGNGNGTGNPGISPEADIVFVHFSNGAVEAVLADGGSAVDKSLGDTTELVEAVDFIFEIAEQRPCVVNISLALHGGPHDGTALVEQSIDALVSNKPNRAVVIAAGNSYYKGIHSSGTVAKNDFTDLYWDIPRGHWQYKAMEIWYAGADKFLLEIFPPNGEALVSLQLGENGDIVDENDNTVIYLSHRFCDPNNGDNMIGIFMESKLPGGVWTVRLHGIEVNNGSFHAWIEREDGSQTSFVPPHDNTNTVSSIGCGHNIIMVGSYDPTKPGQPLSYFSSSGPTRDGRKKPDFIAPGQNIWAASSLTQTKSSRKSGTSMSAPVVTGIIALMLSEARDRKIELDINQIRDILIQSAENNPPEDPLKAARYGYGPISINAAISAVRTM